MIKFTLNEKELEVEEGTTILEAALEADVKYQLYVTTRS